MIWDTNYWRYFSRRYMWMFRWISVIFFAAFVVVTIIFNIAQAVYFIKCFRIKQCSNKNCHFKQFCKKYKKPWTKEDLERINRLIEELQWAETAKDIQKYSSGDLTKFLDFAHKKAETLQSSVFPHLTCNVR